MNNLCTDIGYYSLNKFGEQLCGDHVDVAQGPESAIVVLADGLKSGVKASILSTLTAKILSTLLEGGLELEECVRTIAATLPVSKEHGVAYSTFSVIRIIENREAELIVYDNPHIILLRDGKRYEFPKTILEIDGKTIYLAKMPIKLGDIFIALSDGAIGAGPGKALNPNWKRENIADFMEMMADGDFTAKTLATMLMGECDKLYEGHPADDTTACVVKVRERNQVNLMIGPPSRREDEKAMMSLFFSKAGKHIVCGGTTSHLAADYLGVPLDTSTDYLDPEIPPTSKIAGVDLVTEGAITINRVLSYAQNYLEDNQRYAEWSYKPDGASQIARMLFEEATDIDFYVGRAVNSAHQQEGSPVNSTIKMRLVAELAECLKKMGKRIKVSYF